MIAHEALSHTVIFLIVELTIHPALVTTKCVE